MRIRKARGQDAVAIHRLIAIYSPDGTLLPRSLEEIRANISRFVVAEVKGNLVGCGALHCYSNGLVEIRSVAVAPNCQRQGAGTRIVERLVREAQRRQPTRIFLFTRMPDFFARLGFAVVAASSLPEKIWKDCWQCPRRPWCDEIPMVHGEPRPTYVFPAVSGHLSLRVLPE